MSDIAMDDGIDVSGLPADVDAYVTYTDGSWPTTTAVLKRFPHCEHIDLTTGLGEGTGIDVESGNAGWNDHFSAVPGWVQSKIKQGIWRPVIYIESSAAAELIDVLSVHGIARDKYRLFTAHWTERAHICAPTVCGNPAADATQWGDHPTFDESLCMPWFFGGANTKPTVLVAPKKPKMKLTVGTGMIDTIPANGNLHVAAIQGNGDLIVWWHAPNKPFVAQVVTKDCIVDQTPRFEVWGAVDEKKPEGPFYLNVFVRKTNGSVWRCYQSPGDPWHSVELVS
jgi:hypothetical protein